MNIKNKNIIKFITSSLVLFGSVFGVSGLTSYFSKNNSSFQNVSTLNKNEAISNTSKSLSNNFLSLVIPPKIGEIKNLKQSTFSGITFDFTLSEGEKTSDHTEKPQITSIEVTEEHGTKKVVKISPDITT